MGLAFTKMQGLGNDFVLVDRRTAGRPVPAALAVRLCDRRRGVGADGVLSMLPSSRAPLAMHVTNADGSVAEMCGNGLRCAVIWAVSRGLLPPGGGTVETGRGLMACAVVEGGQVQVSMGPADFDPARVPVRTGRMRMVDEPFPLGGESLRLTALSMGNPHAVCFSDSPGASLDEDSGPLTERARRLGPLLERDPRFPQRTNAGFARMRRDGVLELVVWERGAGLTEACGTGACAAAAAAVATGRALPDSPLRVRLPGGELTIRVPSDGGSVLMSGPAVAVFEGVWPAEPGPGEEGPDGDDRG